MGDHAPKLHGGVRTEPQRKRAARKPKKTEPKPEQVEATVEPAAPVEQPEPGES